MIVYYLKKRFGWIRNLRPVKIQQVTLMSIETGRLGCMEIGLTGKVGGTHSTEEWILSWR